MSNDSAPVSIPAPDDESWRDRLLFKRKKIEKEDGSTAWIDILDACLPNVVTLLLCHEKWRGVIARDEFSLQIVTRRAPPWREDDRPLVPWSPEQPWTDEDFTRVRNWFVRGFPLDGDIRSMKVTKSDVEDAIPLVAARNAFNPLQDYLRGLQWDGTDRIGGPTGEKGWLHVYMGASDTTYTRTVGRWWIISAVARALRPGCKADCMLVFEGGQGRGKSTACRVLGGDYFTDQIKIDEIGTKDGKQALHFGKWMIEFAELDGLSRAETSRIKASLSGQEDLFRAPYAMAPKEHKRKFIMVASVNEATWLRDETGNRRFWPLKVEEDHSIDIDALTRDREQLLAQAVDLLEQGERWWPLRDDPIAEHLEREQSSRMLTDDWSDRIAEWLDAKGTISMLKARADRNPTAGEYVTTAEIGTEVLKIEIGKWGRADQMRAGGCLSRLGFERAQITHENGRRMWVYRKPERPPDRSISNERASPLYQAPPDHHLEEAPF